ncbi:translation initiation factor eIF3 subunit [Suillus bovinus]|uniref:translation initiation factor eIF3 subunit n=1 Tax=Suillus bovinus TaxID=48563 RepID=UPI001B86731D|nr:translation initiation factor eIF3 subunit [Suillus bovinus]KAG2141187.1 translation initiation factor eIF3 subunit [Suillus bovinus]
MSDWESDDAPAPTAPSIATKKPVKSKWEGEDEDESSPVSDWEASSDESSDDDKPPAAPVAPPKKKGTVKQKIAEKEAAKAALVGNDDLEYDEDSVLDPREKARLDREREIKADLDNAAALFGAAGLGADPSVSVFADTSSSELDALISADPRTKEDFQDFSTRIIEFIVKRHQTKPLYASFVEHHVRELCQPLKDIEIRKAASGLTTLANEKQKEQRDKTSGKKKVKAATKPVLGSAKVANKFDTGVYDEALDDFGTNQDDFM